MNNKSLRGFEENEELEIHEIQENQEENQGNQENLDNKENQDNRENKENPENTDSNDNRENETNLDNKENKESNENKENLVNREIQKNKEDAKKEDEDPRLIKVKNGLKKSMISINETLEKINEWDKLLELKRESKGENGETEEKSFRKKCIDNIYIFITFGVIFCVVNLIGVQASIIILNSLFNELVEEFKLWLNKTPRKFNFYQRLEINTYRDLPEIDVVMITSSIGIIFLKNFGFYCSIITLQLLSSVSFFLIFLLFEFHKGEQLLENYTRLEIVVLILAYVLLSFIVGCSSTIALKEYFTIDAKVFEKKKEFSEKGQKIAFYFVSGISLFLTIIFQRQIFKRYKPITAKMVLIWISIICASSFIISLIFHILFLIPVKVKKKKSKKGESKENKLENENINYNKRIPFRNENEQEQELNDLNQAIDINNKYVDNIINSDLRHNTKDDLFNRDNNFQNITNRNNQEEKNNYFTKICTFCGYIYLQKDSKDEHICICYYYSNKCTWFKETICKFDVIAPFLIELYCQISVIGYKSILTEKLLEDFSYKKNIKYFLALFLISVSLASMLIPADNNMVKKPKENNTENNAKPKQFMFNSSFDKNFWWTIKGILFTFTLFILGSSACYYMEMSITKKRWDYIYMVGFGAFKTIDLMLLSFYDFFDNSDIFNTTLAITFEKLLWMIIEAIIYSFDFKNKILIVIQIIISSLAVLVLIIAGCYECYTDFKKNDCCCCCCHNC